MSDPQKRKRYDTGADLEEDFGGFGGGGFGGGGIDPNIIFQSFFGGGGDRKILNFLLLIYYI